MILQDGESGAGGAPNGGRRPRVHMFAWPTLRMVICLVLNVGATVALTAIWLHHGNCTDGLIVVSTIFFGTFALREGGIILEIREEVVVVPTRKGDTESFICNLNA